MAYLLDTNIFIESHNNFYAPDLCPDFWNWLSMMNTFGLVFSIEKVLEELQRRADPLATWASTQRPGFFLPLDGGTLASMGAVAQWAVGSHYQQQAQAEFLGKADSFLVAQAHAGGHILVTREVANSSTKKIKIPQACAAMNVTCLNPFEMLRREGVRFVIPPRAS